MKRFAILLTLLLATTASAEPPQWSPQAKMYASLTPVYSDESIAEGASLAKAYRGIAVELREAKLNTFDNVVPLAVVAFESRVPQANRRGLWRPFISRLNTDLHDLSSLSNRTSQAYSDVLENASAGIWIASQQPSSVPITPQPTQTAAPSPTPKPAEPSGSPTLVVTSGGYYLLTQDALGSPTLTKLTQVVVLGERGPTPDPTPDPTPTADALHRSAVTTALNKITDPNKTNVKTALGKLYRTVAGLPVTERSQLVTSTDLLFNALGLPAEWTTWKAAVDASLNRFTDLAAAKRGWVIAADVLEGK